MLNASGATPFAMLLDELNAQYKSAGPSSVTFTPLEALPPLTGVV
jgi:hypothetical protein